MCSSDKEDLDCDYEEVCQVSSSTMPDKGLVNLKRDDHILVVRGNIASMVILCSGELIYAVFEVPKSFN